jgi:hypothetical protein
MQAINIVSPDRPSSDEAALFIVNQTMTLEPNTLTLLMLGPPSNLARALQIEPKIAQRLRQVVLVGGELTGSDLDTNFRLDRGAVRAVLKAPVEKWLVPMQLSAQVVITEDWIKSFVDDCCSKDKRAVACAHQQQMRLQTQIMPALFNPAIQAQMGKAHKMFQTRRWEKSWQELASEDLSSGFIPWDITGVLVLARPKMFPQWRHAKVDAPPCAGGAEPCDGNMAVLDAWKDNGFNSHKIGDWSGVVKMPIEHNAKESLRVAARLLCMVPTTADPASEEIALGAVPVIVAVPLMAVLLFMACLRLVCACACRRKVSAKEKSN